MISQQNTFTGKLTQPMLQDVLGRLWLNLQSRYELEREKDHLAQELARIRPLASA